MFFETPAVRTVELIELPSMGQWITVARRVVSMWFITNEYACSCKHCRYENAQSLKPISS